MHFILIVKLQWSLATLVFSTFEESPLSGLFFFTLKNIHITLLTIHLPLHIYSAVDGFHTRGNTETIA